MKIKYIVPTILLALIGLKGNGQTVKQTKADKDYAQYAYIDAIATYEKVAEKGIKSVDLFHI